MDGEFRQSLNACSVFPQRVFDNAEVEAGNDDVVPAVSNAAQSDIEHGDNLIAERFVAVESDGAEELLAFGVTGIVRAGIGLLLSQVDLSADATGDFFGVPSKEIDQ